MNKISLKEQFKIWSHVALHSFGGPAGQIAIIHKKIIEEKKLISEERFLHALNFCMLLPGPEAQQLATYMGWLMNGWRGGLLAGGLFILPGFLSILLLSFLYVVYQDVGFVQGLFYGMKPAIIAIVTAALVRISQKSLTTDFYKSVAALSFIALFFFNISFPLVVILSGISGIIYGKFYEHHHLIEHFPEIKFPRWSQTVKTFSIWLLVWFLPIFVTLFIFGKDSTFHQMNLFFSKMSMVTFGGAYAALNYVAQQAVDIFGWLHGAEMIDGLAMAETTPGPLIQSVQFVGFMGAMRFPDLASPLMSGFLASILTTWMTFAPCFLWIFTFAPYVEFLRNQKIFSDALRAISAAVVGVILNLSLWFLLKTLFSQTSLVKPGFLSFEVPIWETLDGFGLGLAILAFILQFAFKLRLLFVLIIPMILGIVINA